MRKFTLRLLLFLTPVIVIFLETEYLLRTIPNHYKEVNQSIQEDSEDLETLVLGSSHTFEGVDTKYFSSRALNASQVSQSIDIDHEVLQLIIERTESIQQVVLPLDYFSLHYQLGAGEESWRIKNYNIYYRSLQLSCDLAQNFEVLSFPVKTNFNRIKDHFITQKEIKTPKAVSQDGHLEHLKWSGIEAAKRHTNQDNELVEYNTSILRSILAVCNKRGIKVILITCPAHVSYTSLIEKNQLEEMYSIINETCSEYSICQYYDFLNDTSFAAADFRDADHLNSAGAKKFSNKLNDIICNVSKSD